MRIEYAELSLLGDREDNQDRVTVVRDRQAALLVVIDGMGGHSDGSRAADTALKSLLDSFRQTAAAVVRSARLPAHGAEPRARRRGEARQRPVDRHAAARDHRDLPGPGRRGVLGARRRQPRLPHAPRQDPGAHPRSQPRRAAAARRQDHRGGIADAPDAQLRRMLPRRRSRDSGDDRERPARAAARRRAASVHRRHLGESARRGHRGVLPRRQPGAARLAAKRWAAAPCRHPRRSATTAPPPSCAGTGKIAGHESQTQRPRPRRAAARAHHPPFHPPCGRLGARRVRRHARALHGLVEEGVPRSCATPAAAG